MAGATRAQIRQRVRDIIAVCPSPTMGTDITAAADLAALPAYEVILTGVTRQLGRQQVASDMTVGVRVLVYTAPVSDVDIEKVIFPLIVAAEAQIDPVADWIAQHQNLRLNDGGLVSGVTSISDNNAGILDYRKNLFVGFILEFNVFVRH